MKHESKLSKGGALTNEEPTPVETPGAAKQDCTCATADSNASERSACDNHLARLEKLADSLWDWSERLFSLAMKNDEGPVQTAALARDAMNLGKGYATMLETIDQRRAKQMSER